MKISYELATHRKPISYEPVTLNAREMKTGLFFTYNIMGINQSFFYTLQFLGLEGRIAKSCKVHTFPFLSFL